MLDINSLQLNVAEEKRKRNLKGLKSETSYTNKWNISSYFLDFFHFYIKKIKISKIYGGFEKFQNYTPVAPWLGDRT